MRLAQQSTKQARPVGVRKTSIVLLSIVVGHGLGLAWVALRSFFDRRLHGTGDVERGLTLPVLAVVPGVRRPLQAG